MRRSEMKRILAMVIVTGVGMSLAGSAYAQTAQATPKAPPGGTMESESTTKHKGPGPNTKVKSQTVVGIVKTYEAGKKIVVTGPKKKNYSFDLDENAGVTGDIAVGQKVKVTYSKSASGKKVTTVAPYETKKKAS
jgi:hypothetical protein